MKKQHILLIAFLFISKLTFAQSDITQGLWYNDEKIAKVQFYQQGTKLYGKIVWMKEPNENGKPRVDKLNPNDKLRTRPLQGLIFLTGFTSSDKKIWEDGQIYDPKTGKTYSSKMTLVSPKELDVRGYMGVSWIGRTSKFTKAE